MFQLKARSRFLDLKGSIKLYYVLAVGIFFAILSFVVYTDIIVTITMIVCTIVSYYLLSTPPKEIEIVLDEDMIKIDDYEIKWEDCVEWAVVDLHDSMEFVIRTTKFNHQFYYFYLDEGTLQTKQLIAILSAYLPYSESTPGLNPIHKLLRNWGLK
jgi:hypothetical protein